MRAGAKLKLLDLFSGIGGFSLGLERTGGFETVAFCEIETFPRKVLAKHWPEVPCYEDIRDLNASRLRADGITVDAICGGFPCQDISTAGKGAGIEGERSGLWSEYARLIGELRPSVVFVENVSALLGRGLDKVLGDLAALGYDAEWHCIPASAVGAPHRRDRLWLVAYPDSTERWAQHRACGLVQRQDGLSQGQEGSGGLESDGQTLANTNMSGCKQGHKKVERQSPEQSHSSGFQSFKNVPDTNNARLQGRLQDGIVDAKRREIASDGFAAKRGSGWTGSGDRQWSLEPAVGRMVDGYPGRVDRLKALGNAVVPQIPELLGNAYLEAIGWGVP